MSNICPRVRMRMACLDGSCNYPISEAAEPTDSSVPHADEDTIKDILFDMLHELEYDFRHHADYDLWTRKIMMALYLQRVG